MLVSTIWLCKIRCDEIVCIHDTASKDRCWFWIVAFRNAVSRDDRASGGTRRRLGPGFLLAIGSSARAVPGTRRGRDAFAHRVAHLADETRTERAALEPAASADGGEIVRIAGLSVRQQDGDGGRHRIEFGRLRRMRNFSGRARQAVGRRNRGSAHGLERSAGELSWPVL